MISLNIVAHPDDDLLSLNPDILHDLENGAEVKVFYLTRGDDGRDCEYTDKREDASYQAYFGKGVFSLTYAPIKSNSLRNGDVYGSLYEMWNNHWAKVDTFQSVQLYDYDTVLKVIRAEIASSKADIIRTHDPDVEPAIFEGGETLDHIDHIYTAKFVQEAAKSFPSIPVYAYMGYPIRYQPDNVSEELAQKKLAMWRRYQEIDTEVAGEQWDIAMNRCYKRKIQ